MANTARLTVKGIDGPVEVGFDVEAWRGDVLETLEEHLGGESVYVWARRWVDSMQNGVRISEFRTRDIIGLVFLGVAQVDPDRTWQSVSRAIAPYSIEFLPDEPATPPPGGLTAPVTVGVLPDLGQQVPDPGGLAPSALDVPGLHEAPPVPSAEDFYRTSAPAVP